MDPVARHAVSISGQPSGQPLMFAHGFGCDRHMWRHVATHFEDTYRVILFDLAGAGRAGAAYDSERHSTLGGYARDVLEICAALELHDVVFVGHSVSAMIGALAAIEEPDRFAELVMIGPSARYLNDGDYVGGFEEADITEMLDSLKSNYLGWSAAMAPAIVGNADRPELGLELTESFCRMDPDIAHRFAQVTFLGDNREDLALVQPETLVLQCRDDVIAPVAVGEFVHQHLPRSRFVLLDATGHCPNLSAPAATIAAMEAFLATASDARSDPS